MPTTSPGTAPGRTVSDLGLPGRAVTALTRAGVTTAEQLARLTRRDLAAISGLGPGSIAAIRAVVPEPPAHLPAAGTPPQPADAAPASAEEESPAAPAIPSFESLRSPRRRTTVDLIVPATPPPPEEPAPPRRAAAAPRPAEYADLWRLGVRAARAAATLPVRVALCVVRAPARRLRRVARG